MEKDVAVNDAIHYKRVGENALLHHSDAQRWYYLSDMRENDLVVFRNVDSQGKLPSLSQVPSMLHSAIQSLSEG
ncbi:unnamed protein product [Clonostachys rosea]|uniref:Uncharacterized protein n=1 Tax=Bionectria ochroleuca TaxID=29856 RepID=A0ABY6ULB3_BIOOC|nr:unnamed protein product [Clonostachys rosea]